MKYVHYVLMWSMCFLCHNIRALSRSDVLAVNSIEKELHLLLQKKPAYWQQKMRMGIDQLEKNYVTKGYQQERLMPFKQALISEEPLEREEQKGVDVLHPETERTVQTQEREAVITPEERKERAQEIIVREKNKPVQVGEQSPAHITRTIEFLSHIPEVQRSTDWNATVNKYIFALSTTDVEKAKEYFEKINLKKEDKTILAEPKGITVAPKEVQTVTVPEEEKIAPKEPMLTKQKQEEVLPVQQKKITIIQPKEIVVTQKETQPFIASEEEKTPQKEPVERKQIREEEPLAAQKRVHDTQKNITQKIESLVTLPADKKNKAWEKEINALIFDLAAYDKEKADSYISQIYVRAGMAMPVFGGPPPPLVLGAGPLPKPGGPPPPPMMTGGPKAPPLPGVIPQKPKAPVITLGSLRKMEDQMLIDMFAKHLNELDKQWNERAEERVETPTKYGKKVEIIRGAPEISWGNTLNTIKKVILEKKLMPEQDVIEAIEKRIISVRAEKAAKAPSVAQEEKVTEEITQADLERQLKTLLSNPKTTEMSWLVGVKSAIKKLDAFDNAAALKYQEEYVQLLPKEKRFIKPK